MGISKDIKRVVVLGSGPIVIGQACEFDYSGTQACKALMQRGLEVILINSNPATIMTDPETATRVYIEPLTSVFVEDILRKERPSHLIPTLGGQTALNLALELDKKGVLRELGIGLLGAKPEVIRKAENREEFRQLLESIGAGYPESELVRSFKQGMEVARGMTFPLVLRPNYTLGGGGSGVAHSIEEYERKLVQALRESPTSEVLVERSLLGWCEFELEVMRDSKGTFVVVCSVENMDPCGVHTGDSCSVSPQQTLSDVEYQAMRDEAGRIISAVGVETGGANIQFAVHPKTRKRLVIEMNPRVSRSSALASKATGFPIAKVAALVAVGLTMDDIRNDITGGATPSCYEPALDYVVFKIPRFDFEKFEGSKDVLNTQMKSVGEVMGIGRVFLEACMKAVVSLEKHDDLLVGVDDFSLKNLTYPNSRRLYSILEAFRRGHSVQQVQEWTQIHPWFLEQFYKLIVLEKQIKAQAGKLTFKDTQKSKKVCDITQNIQKKDIKESIQDDITGETKEGVKESIRQAKRFGVSDFMLAHWYNKSEEQIRSFRHSYSIVPAFYQVDTCAGEFASSTPYYYSTYWHSGAIGKSTDEALGNTTTDINTTSGSQEGQVKNGNFILILGSGPNRIGQGIEFDYSCVRSVRSIKRAGYRAVMVNSNPETVSTDYDTADVLFFEPLTKEHVIEVLRFISPIGFVAQVGGQTPIGLAKPLVKEGFKLIGTKVRDIDRAEDRGQFVSLCTDLGLRVPKAGVATDISSAITVSKYVGYPLLCRPSYVLGGRRMEMIENESELRSYFSRYQHFISQENPCLMDQFLEGLEVDVDLVCGVDWVVIGGIVEHIEGTGVHSGDSMGVLPPQRLKQVIWEKIEKCSALLARNLNILGFLNLQLAIKDDCIYVLEANPRSSRSMPYVSKATGIPLADLAVKAMLKFKAKDITPSQYNWKACKQVCVKGVVFPFKKFEDVDSILGPEMKSIGEVMGRSKSYPVALLKALAGMGLSVPKSGEVFLSLRDKDKKLLLPVARQLVDMGYSLSATGGTFRCLTDAGIACLRVKKVHEGRPHCVDRIRSGKVAFVINTTSGRRSIEISFSIRRSCLDQGVPCITQRDAAVAVVSALYESSKSLSL